jgi:hypothetical protein
MAYIYQVGFDIKPEQMNQLEIGSSLERVLGYLRALLPSSPGFISVRAMNSLDIKSHTHLMVESLWEMWEDLLAHRQSALAEDKVFTEFSPHVDLQDLQVHIYSEVD